MPKTIGLALGGGGARGLAHIGVLEVLQREGVPVDLIAGTSSGAMIGALYALTGNIGLAKEQALEADRRAMAGMMDFTLSRRGIVAGRRLRGRLQRIIGAETRFGNLKVPLACVAADIYAAEEVAIRDGVVWEAVHASMSLPVAFRAVELDGRYLVDGGLIDPVPVRVARSMGADIIICVNVIPDLEEWSRLYHERGTQRGQPGIFTVALQVLEIGSSLIARNAEKECDIIIKPSLAGIGYMEFFRAAEAIEEGVVAARRALPEIRRVLAGDSGRT